VTEPAGKEEYERGVAAGRVWEKLDEYGRHFARLNGSIEASASANHELAIAVRQLIVESAARDAALVEREKANLAMAIALEKRADRSWAPWQRVIAVVLALVSLSALIVSWVRG
jgi:hypothetical protein